MTGRLPSLIPIRLLAALLLAAIGLQATSPIAATLQPTHGSAFSVTTYEVALAPQRQREEVRQLVAPLPTLPPTVTESRALPAFAVLIGQSTQRPDSTGPPAKVILARQPAPRAPPLA